MPGEWVIVIAMSALPEAKPMFPPALELTLAVVLTAAAWFLADSGEALRAAGWGAPYGFLLPIATKFAGKTRPASRRLLAVFVASAVASPLVPGLVLWLGGNAAFLVGAGACWCVSTALTMTRNRGEV